MERATSPQRRGAPTIRDVARRAGVGVGTVSRVLNDSPLVTEETEQRVRRAIEQLGYRRSTTARNLSLGRTNAVGVVAPLFTSPSATERLRGVISRLSARGYDVVLFAVETARQRADAFRDFARRDRVDGLLVISLALSGEEVAALERDRLPVVLVDVGHPRFSHVVIDNVRGGELATQHLLAKGHRRIGFVADASSGTFVSTASDERRRGYRRALERAGIVPADELITDGADGRAGAQRLTSALLRSGDPPTAIFAASDLQAIGVLEGAASLGRRVPDDLAVIGFDDIEMASVLGLTTVRQPLHDTGARGADLLVQAIQDGQRRPVVELEPLTVVERRTT